MAVVGLAREARDSPTSAREGDNGISITRRFLVEVNDRGDGPGIVLAAPGLPQRGFVYDFGNEYNSYLYCRDRTPKKIGRSWRHWEVECEYRPADPTDPRQRDPGNTTGDPVFDLPVISMQTVKEKVDAVKDRNDDPYVNSANDPFRPHPQRDKSRDRLTITRNEPVTSPIVAVKDQFRDMLNDATFWGRAARRWKCEEINVENDLRIINDFPFPFLRVTYIFDSRESWEHELLDTGFNYIDGSGNKRAFMTTDGREFEGFLNPDGTKTTTPQFLTFETYEEADYSALNLPGSFLDAVRF